MWQVGWELRPMHVPKRALDQTLKKSKRISLVWIDHEDKNERTWLKTKIRLGEKRCNYTLMPWQAMRLYAQLYAHWLMSNWAYFDSTKGFKDAPWCLSLSVDVKTQTLSYREPTVEVRCLLPLRVPLTWRCHPPRKGYCMDIFTLRNTKIEKLVWAVDTKKS